MKQEKNIATKTPRHEEYTKKIFVKLCALVPSWQKLTYARALIAAKPVRKYIIAALLLFASISGSLAAEDAFTKYPSYETIIRTFYSKYSSDAGVENTIMHFAKKPDGWHIQFVETSKDLKELKIPVDLLFWSSAENKFLKIEFPKIVSPEAAKQKINELLSQEWTRHCYASSYYYGYTGWKEDVIAALKDRTDLSDSALYALGRAYSSYASDLLTDDSGLSDPAKRFKLFDGENSMSADQLVEYNKFKKAGIELFLRLYKKNPSFQTYSSNIGHKYANECMSRVMELKVYQNEEEAIKDIPAQLYDSFIIAFAKNYLSVCPKDAILFTNGDNDTYPLLYLQCVLKLRRDILLANVHMLTDSRYINYLRRVKGEAKPLKMSIPPEKYKEPERGTIIFYELQSSALGKDIRDLIEFVLRDNTESKIQSGANKSKFYNYFQSRGFTMKVDSAAAVSGGTVSAADAGKLPRVMKWRMNANNAFRSHLVMLDVISINNWERPLYFSGALNGDYFLGLGDYMQLEGDVFRLVPLEGRGSRENMRGQVKTEIMFKNFGEGFNSFDLLEPGLVLSKMHHVLLGNYRYYFYRLAATLYKEGKKKESAEMIEKCLKLIPESKIPADYKYYYFAKYFYESGDSLQADAMIHKVEDFYDKDLTRYFALKDADDPLNMEEITEGVAVFEKLAELTGEKYKRPFANQLKKKFDIYLAKLKKLKG